MTTTHRDDLGPNTEVFVPADANEPISYAAAPAPEGDPTAAEPVSTAPAVKAPTWSGKKTAIAAALAIGLSGVGAVTAAALVPNGTGAQTGGGPGGQLGRGGPGGAGGPGGGFGQGGQFAPPGQQPGQLGPQGQLGQPGQVVPNAGAGGGTGAAANGTTGTTT